jgi:DNA-binding PadR family transcriptional regulator
MYRDNTLVPTEAMRLLALGCLTEAPLSYAALAQEAKQFTSHIIGPSLDLVGTPLEVLRVERLIAPLTSETPQDPPLLAVTEAGLAEIQRLLKSNSRAPINDISKLIVALKMRFLHLLSKEDQLIQIDILHELFQRQLDRSSTLRAQHHKDRGHLTAWLDHDIDQTRGQLNWLLGLRARIA